MRAAKLFTGAALLLLAVGVAAADTVGYSYDAAGRLVEVHYAGGSIFYEYDPAGNLLTRTVTTGALPSPIEPSLQVDRVASDLAITYPTDACLASDHALFVGTIGDFAAVSTADCSIGSNGEVTVPLPAGNVWFLVAGVEGDRYSSVGDDLAGERTLAGVEASCPSFNSDTSRSCP